MCIGQFKEGGESCDFVREFHPRAIARIEKGSEGEECRSSSHLHTHSHTAFGSARIYQKDGDFSFGESGAWRIAGPF
jgi:hypothetical protein